MSKIKKEVEKMMIMIADPDKVDAFRCEEDGLYLINKNREDKACVYCKKVGKEEDLNKLKEGL